MSVDTGSFQKLDMLLKTYINIIIISGISLLLFILYYTIPLFKPIQSVMYILRWASKQSIDNSASSCYSYSVSAVTYQWYFLYNTIRPTVGFVINQSLHVHVHVYVLACISVYMGVCAWVCVYVFVCVSVYVCACVHVRVCVRAHVTIRCTQAV